MSANLRSFTTSSDASVQQLAVPVPTHLPGDELVVFVMGDNTGPLLVADQSGSWTFLRGTNPGQTLQSWWHRTATESEPDTYSFSSAATAGNMAAVMVAVNPDGDTLNFVTSSTISYAEGTDTGTTPVLTGAADNTVLFAAFIADDTETIATPPTGMSEVAWVDMSASELVVYVETNVGTGDIQRSIVWGTTTDVAQGTVLLSYEPGVPPSEPTQGNPLQISSDGRGSPIILTTQTGVGNSLVIRS